MLIIRNLASWSDGLFSMWDVKKNPNHTSLNENYVPCICLRAIWHMHGLMWRATRMTRDRKRTIVAHCVIALWHHYYYALAKFYCQGRVEGHFSGYPSHKTYTCQNGFSLPSSKKYYKLQFSRLLKSCCRIYCMWQIVCCRWWG